MTRVGSRKQWGDRGLTKKNLGLWTRPTAENARLLLDALSAFGFGIGALTAEALVTPGQATAELIRQKESTARAKAPGDADRRLRPSALYLPSRHCSSKNPAATTLPGSRSSAGVEMSTIA